MIYKIIFFIAISVIGFVQMGYSKNITNCIVISTDSVSIYKLDLSKWNWCLDERWKKGKYTLPCISPSGRYLAFRKFVERGFYIIGLNGKTVVDYNLEIDNHIDLLSWSPTEEYLAFLGTDDKFDKIGNIHIYNLRTKEFRTIYSFANYFDYPSSPSWDGTGKKIYFVNRDNLIIEFDIIANTLKEITGGKAVHWISESKILIRKERKKYYLYDFKSKKEKYLFRLGWWQYPPISLSPDKKFFLCWDTRPRRITLGPQGYTAIREFPSGKTIKVIHSKGANWFSWSCEK